MHFSGIAGDMLVSALADAGADQEAIGTAVHSLNAGATVSFDKVRRAGIAATKYRVAVKEHRHDRRSTSFAQRRSPARAAASGLRLLKNAQIQQRLAELSPKKLPNRLVCRNIAALQNRVDGYDERRQKLLQVMHERANAGWNAPGASTGLLGREIKSVGAGKNFREVEEFRVDPGLLREFRELEKQAAIELGQWTEKRDVKMDANVGIKAEILAAEFTLEELEAMMGVAIKAAERQQQQQPATAAAISSGEDGETIVDVQLVDEGRPKQDEPAEPDTKPDIPEWMR